MKKIIALSFTLLIFGAALTSCSENSETTALPQDESTVSSINQETESYYQVSAAADATTTAQSETSTAEEPVISDENDTFFVG